MMQTKMRFSLTEIYWYKFLTGNIMISIHESKPFKSGKQSTNCHVHSNPLSLITYCNGGCLRHFLPKRKIAVFLIRKAVV